MSGNVNPNIRNFQDFLLYNEDHPLDISMSSARSMVSRQYIDGLEHQYENGSDDSQFIDNRENRFNQSAKIDTLNF
jgi:hypothetical protein